MRPLIAAGDWDELERTYRQQLDRADRGVANAIAAIDLTAYESRLRQGVRDAVRAADGSVAAVYWEFDIDNAWESAFFLCTEYAPEEVGDDDWAASFVEDNVIAGPSMPDFGALLGATWAGSTADVSRSLYLVARTIAAVGRVGEGWPLAVPLCAGFHDQDPVFRIAT